MSFLPPLRKGKSLRTVAGGLSIVWVCFLAAFLFQHFVWHLQWRWDGFIIFSLLCVLLAVFDLSDYYRWRSNQAQPPTINQDRDEAHRA
jgi:membrane protein implicated in regulation of membrane protease activity